MRLPVAVLLLDPDDRIVFANLAAHKLLEDVHVGHKFAVQDRILGTEDGQLIELEDANPVTAHRHGAPAYDGKLVLTTPFQPQGIQIKVDIFEIEGGTSDPRLLGIAINDVETLQRAEMERDQLFNLTAAPFAMLSMDGQVLRVNPACEALVGRSERELRGFGEITHIVRSEDRERVAQELSRIQRAQAKLIEFEARITQPEHDEVPVRWVATADTWMDRIYLVGVDMTSAKRDEQARRELEDKINESRKLESIGQLAAGIAHEINTPVQFSRDNVAFLKGVAADLEQFVASVQKVIDSDSSSGNAAEVLSCALEEFDAEFVVEEVANATSQALSGLDRISAIVRAMKEFSHPGATEKTLVDLNRIVMNTLTVARSEWKFVADAETDLADQLPSICGMPGELGQVVLNIVVNAAHAIGDRVQPGEKGTIFLRTRGLDDRVELEIEDTGGGIPEDIRHKIFDPFFTTKEVGRGTGQGLAIAHRVMKEHGGGIEIETETGVGTTFRLTLPVDDCEQGPRPEVAA